MALDLGHLDESFSGGMSAIVAGTKHPQGKQYRIPPVSGELGTWGRKVAMLQAQLGDNPAPEAKTRAAAKVGEPPVPEGLTLPQALLSPELYDELLDDGVDAMMIKHMAQIAYARIVGGDALALATARGDDPNPKAGNRAERRKAAKKAPKQGGH